MFLIRAQFYFLGGTSKSPLFSRVLGFGLEEALPTPLSSLPHLRRALENIFPLEVEKLSLFFFQSLL